MTPRQLMDKAWLQREKWFAFTRGSDCVTASDYAIARTAISHLNRKVNQAYREIESERTAIGYTSLVGVANS